MHYRLTEPDYLGVAASHKQHIVPQPGNDGPWAHGERVASACGKSVGLLGPRGRFDAIERIGHPERLCYPCLNALGFGLQVTRKEPDDPLPSSP